MEVISSSEKLQFSVVYIGDVAFFSQSSSKAITHVQTRLTLLRYAGVSLKQLKGSFPTNVIYYLGHMMQPRRLALSDSTTKSITGLQDTINAIGLRSFLDLGHYRRSMPKFLANRHLFDKAAEKPSIPV